MPITYEKIASVTVGSGGASSIDFTSIPSSYTDLIIKYSTRSAGNANTGYDMKISFNGSTSSFSRRNILGNGSTATSGNATDNYVGLNNASNMTTSAFANGEVYIPNYGGSSNKSFSSDTVTGNNSVTSYLILMAGLWSNTSAITSISLTDYYGNNLVEYSTATLYGISKS